MPLPSDFHPALDDLINRLATESVLAQPGRDDGLVPAYSLLGELLTVCAGRGELTPAIAAMHASLEVLLDAARPFDETALTRLRELVSWLARVSPQLRAGQAVEPFEAPAASGAAGGGSDAVGDEMLALDLTQNHELLTEFHGEAVDHLQQIEAALLVLDHEPENADALAAIFRAFHTIKGNAGFLGLKPMHNLAHEVESLLDLARNGQLRLNHAIISEILRTRDALQALTQQVAVALDSGRIPNEIVPVSHLIGAVRKLATGGSPACVADRDVEHSDPAVTEAPVPPAAAPTAEAGPDGATGQASAAGGFAAAPKQTAAATVRVSTEKLDSLMDVVGELVIVQSQLAESARDGTEMTLQRNLAQLGRITKDLQHTALSLRMIPIKAAFQKMERLARDLARQCGKKVVFTTSGEETELDRTVVEELGDPLVHMVRNALDHGLESAAERSMTGKPDAAMLHLKAYHQGSNIVVELQDDGRGLDPEKIYRKAVEKGIVTAGTQLSREEIHALIFAPGFSTAEKVTAVSGRGVGMDVVKRNIEKLRGNVEIASEPGRGSVFKIKLPLTMAIIDGLVVRVGTDRFILPSTSVQMALRPSREHVSMLQGEGEVLDLRGRLVPIHRLHRRFGIPADAAHPWEGIVVIVETSGKISALLVDEMITKQEVVIKNLGAFMRNVRGVSGGAILGDGNIALILDPGTLLAAA